MEHFHGPAYRVRTPRLLLRCYELTDAEARMEAMESSGPHLDGYRPVPQPNGPALLNLYLDIVRRYRASFDTDQDRLYAALDPDSGRLLGEVCILQRAGIAAKEVGYWLRRDATGMGFATEMAAAATRVAFELDKAKRVDLMISPENVASAAVAERLKFVLEGRLRDRQLAAHHRRGDLLSFTLLDREYPTSPSKEVPIEAFDALGRRLP